MASRTYQRKTVDLTGDHLDKARGLIESGRSRGGVIEWADKRSASLTLRITSTAATWHLRRRDLTIRVGSIEEFGVDTARYIADHAAVAADRKRDLRTFVKLLAEVEREKIARGSRGAIAQPWRLVDKVVSDPASPLAQRILHGETEPWTWETLTRRFLEEKTLELKEGYREAYSHYLQLDEFGSVNNKRVSEIRLPHLEHLRDQIARSHAPSAVHRALQQSKEMLTWAWKFHGTKSGLQEVEYTWWDRWSFKYKTGKRRHRPTVEELVRTLIIAEHYRSLYGNDRSIAPGTLGAFWAVVLTAQRAGSLVRMRHTRIAQCPGHRNWKVARWTGPEMKGGRHGGRPHDLPLAPAAFEVLMRFRNEADSKSEWMFPSAKIDGHVTNSALNQLLYRLEGKDRDTKIRRKPDRNGKPGPKPKGGRKARPNLLQHFNIRPWTLHDVRRTLTKFLDDNRLGGAASAILAHKLVNDDLPEEETMAAITESHYNSSQKIALKVEGMKLWSSTIFKTYESERRKFKPIQFSQSDLRQPRQVGRTSPDGSKS
jgi:hypothetical protein